MFLNDFKYKLICFFKKWKWKILSHHWLPHESDLDCGHRFAFLQSLHLTEDTHPLVSGPLALQTLSSAACIAPHTVPPTESWLGSLDLTLHYCDCDHHCGVGVTRHSIARLTDQDSRQSEVSIYNVYFPLQCCCFSVQISDVHTYVISLFSTSTL